MLHMLLWWYTYVAASIPNVSSVFLYIHVASVRMSQAFHLSSFVCCKCFIWMF
jgi:hypothetical protein